MFVLHGTSFKSEGSAKKLRKSKLHSLNSTTQAFRDIDLVKVRSVFNTRDGD